MNKRIFDPNKYGMATCPSCDSHGYIQYPKRQCCPRCNGFGFIMMEPEQDTKILPGDLEILDDLGEV